jgi:hypothetical protein
MPFCFLGQVLEVLKTLSSRPFSDHLPSPVLFLAPACVRGGAENVCARETERKKREREREGEREREREGESERCCLSTNLRVRHENFAFFLVMVCKVAGKPSSIDWNRS